MKGNVAVIRDATFLQTGGRGSGAALATPTQVLKADQTNRCVDSLNELMFLHEVDLLKLSLSPSASPCSLSLFDFFLSCVISTWVSAHLLNPPSPFSVSRLSLAYLALEPSSYSQPGSQSLSKGILLSRHLPALFCIFLV